MAKPSKPERLPTPGDSDVNLLAWIATCVSIFAFLFYYRHAEVMLYGDAIAHINIARRVFDSRTPGLLQLGTVWLPLPHLLMIPFLISTEMWRCGVGGSIPSMAAYVFAVIGIFRLTRSALSRTGEPDGFARVAAWTAAIIFAANPNLIYIQSTAMGETVYLAFFVWSVAYFTESLRGKTSSLTKSALCLGAACLTRYDGWFLAVILSAIVILRSFLTRESHSRVPSRSQVIKFVLIAAMAPALWIIYNAAVYRNPLEFANGPYSARAIERRTQSAGHPGHPGSGNPFLAGLYFVKSGEDNVAQNQWVQRIWILLMLAAMVGALLVGPWRKTFTPLLLLLTPLPFYALSIAYGGVPIFIPNWWPYTHYNVRYGLQLLPLLSVALAMLVYLALRADARKRYMRLSAMLGIFLLVIVSYASIWEATPIVLAEAQANMRTRNQLQLEVARWLEKLPPDSTLLMYLGDHVGALERAGVPLKRTINEGNHRVWKQPADSEGFWERALANPSQYVDYVLAFDGDPVWQAVHNLHLRELIELHVTGQPRAILYRAR
jgi:hypothetical protein